MSLALDAREQLIVGQMWAFRARSENQAAARFARIHARLVALEADPRLVEMAARAIEDERRHRSQCAELAERFGASVPADELVEPEVPEVAPADLSPAQRLTYELVAFCCLTESINAALLSHSYAVATEPDSRAVIRSILADEVQHARLGWAHLGLTKDRAWLADRFVPMLEATVPAELRDPRIQPEASAALRAHGVFERGALRGILRESVAEVIVPGMATLGIEPGAISVWMRDAGF